MDVDEPFNATVVTFDEPLATCVTNILVQVQAMLVNMNGKILNLLMKCKLILKELIEPT